MNGKISDDSERAGELLSQAKAFTESPAFVSAFGRLGIDTHQHAVALKDSRAFLTEAGLTLPDGLALDFFQQPPRFFPVPDWMPFMIELINCRTVYVWECDDTPGPIKQRKCGLKEYQICLGYRIYPHPWPRGPY